MQKDSAHISTSGPRTHNEDVTQGSLIKSLHCSHCTLILKSKVYLFDHLLKVHGAAVDTALRESGLKRGEEADAGSKSISSENNFLSQQCDVKSKCVVIHDKQTNEIAVVTSNLHKEGAVMSPSKSTCAHDSLKEVKMYKRPLQMQPKYSIAASGSNGNTSAEKTESPVIPESNKGTLILQSSSNSSSDSSGVFQVTAKSMIDMCTNPSYCSLLSDPLVIPELRPPEPKGQFKEPVPGGCKRADGEWSESCPAKKTKSHKTVANLPNKANAAGRQAPSIKNISFEISEDEEENKVNRLNGNAQSPKLYFCKHCVYTDAALGNLSTHYQDSHPYVRYNTVYIQDPSDQSATFRCLECPVEFVSIVSLKRHYTACHPEAPEIFSLRSHKFCLVFKCFVCPFTTDELRALKEHHKDKHPKHEISNSLLYCRYSGSTCKEGASQPNTCEEEHGPEGEEEVSPKNATAQYVEDKNAPSPQHPTPEGAETVLYHCNSCMYRHESVVALHIHYQKNHPDEAVTLEHIRLSARVTSRGTSQLTLEKFVKVIENPTPQQNISASSSDPKHTEDASSARSDSLKAAEGKRKTSPAKRNKEATAGMDSSRSVTTKKMFYCQFCDHSSFNIRSVVAHHNGKHAAHGRKGIEEVLCYSAKLEKKKLQSEVKASENAASAQQVEVRREKELQREEDNTADASTTLFNPYAYPENLFYCKECNYANPSVMGVLKHQISTHKKVMCRREFIIEHTDLIRQEIKKSKSHTKKLPFCTNLPLPLMKEGDEDRLFCHFCNFRHNDVSQVLKHYLKRHRGFAAKSAKIYEYTSMLQKKMQKSHLVTSANQEASHASVRKKGNEKKSPERLAGSASVSAPQTHRVLRCPRCSYSSPYVYLLRKHMCNIHRTKHSTGEVLKLCFKKGMLQSGHHCTFCVFSHKNAGELYKHFQEHHPSHVPTLQYISARLYVGPDAFPTKRRKPKKKNTDGVSDGDGTGSSLAHRFEKNEVKTFSCRACSFKGSSMSVVTRHCRAAHPWSVKDDGSVLNVITSRKQSANSQVEDHSEMPESFSNYQAPLQFDDSPDLCNKAAASPTLFKCRYCSATFQSHHGLRTHLGMKHQEAVTENLDEHQTHVRVYKCPYCPYVNTICKGVVTHCQMRHPASEARADSLDLDKTNLCIEKSLERQAHGDSLKFNGYMCEACPQIYAVMKKLLKHKQDDHDTSALNPSLKPSAARKIQGSKSHSILGSVSKASFLHKKIYEATRCQHCSYFCSTRIALSQHLRIYHRNASFSEVKDCIYSCDLCSKSFFKKRHLGNHYTKKHGKDAFLKYYTPVYVHAIEDSALKSPECSVTQQPDKTSEARESSTTTEEKKILIYKCPSCPYVNANNQGTLTHCQMKHPGLAVRADALKTDEVLVTNMVGYTMGKADNERGYMCKKCPQIHATLRKLMIHCETGHEQAESGSSAETHTVYKCYICTYKGSCRKYLYCHYRKTHGVDMVSTYRLLEKYNKRKCKVKFASLSEDSVKCKKCPNLMFDSPRLLCTHYSSFHSSDWISDFTVLSEESTKTAGIYKCSRCEQQLAGNRELWHHLDRCRAREEEKAEAAETMASPVVMTAPQDTFMEICRQDELPMLESVEDLTQWNVTPAETFILPASPLSLPSKPTDVEQPEPEPGQDIPDCQQCGRTFMSLKGLRSHERSHEALATIKKLDHIPNSVIKKNLTKYFLYKSGTLRPFLCNFCPYRTTVLGLWTCHFMKQHQDVIREALETASEDNGDAQMTNQEPPNSSQDTCYFPEPEEELGMNEKSLYSEPKDVQRQLNHYSLMAQTGDSVKANLQEPELPENNLLHCEFCTFRTGHLSSVRRHYLNRHGKKMLRCKDCNFFTGLRKTLELHVQSGHSTCQSEPTHQKDLRCPFCLYQTKNKNNMIDHIILHREERVVPIEVRRPKLSRYLRGVILRCHKCTFTTGCAEKLHAHMRRHDDIKPYNCRLCYYDCTLLSDLEAHLNDKHQVLRNHELVGQVNLNRLEARVGRMPEEEEESLSDRRNNETEDVEMEEFVTNCNKDQHEAQATKLAGNNTTEKVPPRTKETYGKHEQGLQKQTGSVFLPNTARGQRTEDAVEQNVQSTTLNKKAGQERTVKIQQDTGTLIMTDTPRELPEEDGSITLTHNPKPEVNSEAKKNHMQSLNIKGQENYKVESNTLTLTANCSQMKTSHEESLGISLTRCKEEVKEECGQNSEEVADPYGEMPVLENEYLMEVSHTLGSCKEEEENDFREQSQVKENEASPHVYKNVSIATDEATKVQCPSGPEKKLYMCQLCGRNLMSIMELHRHIMRHGI